MPDNVSQTPAAPSSGSGEGGGWHWWWLAILLPLLALLGLLAVLARRRAGSRHAVERELDDDSDDDFWPGTRVRQDEVRYDSAASRDFGMWTPPAAEEPSADSDFDSDEDAIDTAPTRIPGGGFTDAPDSPSEATEAHEVEAGDWFGVSESRAGRHSANAAVSPATWRLDLDEFTPTRHRHAVDLPPLADEHAEDVVDDVRFESRFDQDEDRFDQESEVPADEPWRPAIHLPLADPLQAPEGYVIKGNTHSGLYYTPDSLLYDNTIPEVWFASEDLAQANGFVKAPE